MTVKRTTATTLERARVGAAGRLLRAVPSAIEALVLSSLGGAIGVLIGVAITTGAQPLVNWPLSIPVNAIGSSFGFAAVVGVVFGVYPARRASQLDPIQALRSE